ncbi:YvrJ family protein [Alteribacillus sp. HJP-4]|uniref:YvrJ family protein n=1 Tax=Alteribacillus sp. HJP-4 TaxID=2775394 RepID=UPI0035CCD2BE
MEMWLNAAGEHGMTAVIAFYLLHRMEKKLDILIAAVKLWPESGNTEKPGKNTA